MQRLKRVANGLIRKILEAGERAPSGGNMQRWRFLVIRDANVKKTVGAYYKRAWDEQIAPATEAGEPASRANGVESTTLIARHDEDFPSGYRRLFHSAQAVRSGTRGSEHPQTSQYDGNQPSREEAFQDTLFAQACRSATPRELSV
jgi:nitroreductase